MLNNWIIIKNIYDKHLKECTDLDYTLRIVSKENIDSINRTIEFITNCLIELDKLEIFKKDSNLNNRLNEFFNSFQEDINLCIDNYNDENDKLLEISENQYLKYYNILSLYKINFEMFKDCIIYNVLRLKDNKEIKDFIKNYK